MDARSLDALLGKGRERCPSGVEQPSTTPSTSIGKGCSVLALRAVCFILRATGVGKGEAPSCSCTTCKIEMGKGGLAEAGHGERGKSQGMPTHGACLRQNEPSPPPPSSAACITCQSNHKPHMIRTFKYAHAHLGALLTKRDSYARSCAFSKTFVRTLVRALMVRSKRLEAWRLQS